MRRLSTTTIGMMAWSKRVCVLLVVVSLLFDLSVCLCRPECLSVTGLRFTYCTVCELVLCERVFVRRAVLFSPRVVCERARCRSVCDSRADRTSVARAATVYYRTQRREPQHGSAAVEGDKQ